MKTISKISLLIILSILISPSSAFSDVKVYTIGVEDVPYYPHYTVKDGQYIGFVREVFDAFAQKNEYQFVYKPLPIKRLKRYLILKKIDFLYPHNPEWRSDEMEKINIRYSKISIDNVIDGIMVLPKNKGRGLDKLKYVGTILGYTAPPYEDMFKSNKIIKHESVSFERLLNQVIYGRTDGAYLTVDSSIYLLNEIIKNPGALVFDPDLPYEICQHFLATIKHNDVMEKFDVFLEKESDLISKLRKKYKIMEYVK